MKKLKLTKTILEKKKQKKTIWKNIIAIKSVLKKKL